MQMYHTVFTTNVNELFCIQHNSALIAVVVRPQFNKINKKINIQIKGVVVIVVIFGTIQPRINGESRFSQQQEERKEIFFCLYAFCAV